MITNKQINKISKIYFQNVTGGGLSADNLANHFVSQLLSGAKETQEYDGELYIVDKGVVKVQLTFFLIKLLREF